MASTASPKSTETAVKQTAQSVEQQTRKVADTARELKHSSARIEGSADRTTVLAADRNILASERTYAAWVRTGLLALGAGIGARALKDVPNCRQWHIVDRVQPVLLRRGRVAAFSSRSAPAGTVGEDHAVAGAACRQCDAVPNRGWRIGHALVDATLRLRMYPPDLWGTTWDTSRQRGRAIEGRPPWHNCCKAIRATDDPESHAVFAASEKWMSGNQLTKIALWKYAERQAGGRPLRRRHSGRGRAVPARADASAVSLGFQI